MAELRSCSKGQLLIVILEALSLHLAVPLGEHERRLAAPILLEDALL